ncbi:hypothetical protein MEG05_15740 [Vibrio aestuarianus]|uniref:hypothetical protein n=1 Tax=Vibrio aestuarianus TaxID=28171 RepID=UPI00237CC0FE|nr:hypothetical protein [Vibrio aestuarianus]MDE1315510.1 hypothetical protein [Vibrio aestuarianus]
MDQKKYLNDAKNQLNMTWDELAEKTKIHPRALKTYRMPKTSKDYRTMPTLAKAAIDNLLKERIR